MSEELGIEIAFLKRLRADLESVQNRITKVCAQGDDFRNTTIQYGIESALGLVHDNIVTRQQKLPEEYFKNANT